MNRIFILTYIAFSIICINTYGVPASDRVIVADQPDGTSLGVMQAGNEFKHFKTTTDGYTIAKNSSGVYEYITVTNLFTQLSGVKANDPGKRSDEEITLLNKTSKHIIPVSSQKSASLRPQYQQGTFPATGNHKLLLILVKFSDSNNTYTQTNFDDFMNKDGGANGNGSFRQYYMENSYGKLDITTTVTQWVTLPKPRAYYPSDPNWATILEFAYESVRAADNAGIDFSQFDNNKDGIVDGIAIIHTGEGQEDSGDTDDIWSHSWNISEGNYTEAQRTFDGVVVDHYTVQPEILGSEMSNINVIAHEFGHNLGAQDLYDTQEGFNSQYQGTGKWDIMSNGTWNGSPIGSSPAHHNIYQKELFGWTTLEEIKTDTTYSLRNSAENPDGFIMSTAKQGEYYVFENKQKTGFDRGIPGHGLIIYHVDENHIAEKWWDNIINVSEHQGMYVKPAYGLINSASAPFPGTGNITVFNDTTTPGSLSWDGYKSQKPVFDISESADSIITFSVGGVEKPVWNNFSITNDSVINLSWNMNSQSDSVILVWSYHSFDQALRVDTTYSNSYTFSDSSKVLYAGNSVTSLDFKGAPYGEMQYFILYSKSNGNYSSGVILEAKTNCPAEYTTPFYNGFEQYNAFGPGSCWEIMKSDTSGNNMTPVSKADGDDTWRINNIATGYPFASENKQCMVADASDNMLHWLITPEITLPSGNACLTYRHYFKASEYNVKIFADNSWTELKDFKNSPDNLLESDVEFSLSDFLNKKVKVAFIYNTSSPSPLAIDSIVIDGSDVAQTFDVQFNVNSSGIGIDSATVILDGVSKVTDSSGEIIFEDISPENNLHYSITKEGYEIAEGYINVVNKNIALTINIVAASTTDIEANEISISPNPAFDYLEIKNLGKSAISIFNTSGILVISENINEDAKIDISDLPTGIYIVRIKSDDKVFTGKILKK